MGSHPASILYVEDNPGDVLLMRTAFGEFGRPITFTFAIDGEAALARLKHFSSVPVHERPHLMLLDLNLPRVSGIEVLENSRRAGTLCVPVVILTSASPESERARCMEFGCAGFLRKPGDYLGYRALVQDIELLFDAISIDTVPPDATN